MGDREDVLIIRVTRPAGLDYQAADQAEAEAKGERYAAQQVVAVETADAFVEELDAAWDAVASMATDVQAGRRNLGGEEPRRAAAPAEEGPDGTSNSLTAMGTPNQWPTEESDGGR
jgi:hypothetical protein